MFTNFIRRSTSTVSFLVLIFTSAFSQGTMLLRQPTVSGSSIVFVHADDLWKVGRDGGDAVRLTSAVGSESNPRFSPDGKWIAFTGQYDGNYDVFVSLQKESEKTPGTGRPGTGGRRTART
jgi:tricorn protease